jgi:quinol monooxygenase YgiN
MSALPETRKSIESNSLNHVLIIHDVVDYTAWKRVFDAAAMMRKAAGEQTYQVLRFEADANRIVHFSAWSTHEDAKRFFQSPELEKIRQQAGVKSPDFIYLNQLETGVL